MDLFSLAIVTIVGYLLGAVPFAVLIAKSRGVNILEVGSGNPGSTNVKRTLGKKAGNLCFALDFGKGMVAAGWPMLPFSGATETLGLGIIGLLAAIIGHSYSVFIGFRGGKGVATSAGGILVLFPIPWLVGAVVWVAVFMISRYVSLASMLAAIGIAAAQFVLFYLSPEASHKTGAVFLGLLALIVIYRHRSNIKRLLSGTENRFEKKK